MSDLLTVYDDDQANTFIDCMVNPSYFDLSAQKTDINVHPVYYNFM